MKGFRVACLALVVALASIPAWTAMEMNVAQVTAMVKSSVKMKHPDRDVAGYLKQVKLTEKLDDKAIEELEGAGAGPKTMDALRTLRDASASLTAPKAAPPRPIAAVQPPPDSLTQGKLIDDAREYALNYTKNLPNYICLQVTRRSVDQRGRGDDYRMYDVVTARLSYDGQKEDYKIIRINDRPVETTMEKLGGAKSSGDFATFMKEIFEPDSHAHFDWAKWSTVRGKRQYVFSYAVEKANSKWGVVYEDRISIKPAYHGLIYIDANTHMISRLTMEADLPPDFPVSVAKEILDYDFTRINEQEYLLPMKAEVDMRTGRYLTKNETEFRAYRKFGADASITFSDMDTPPPLPAEKTKEQPAPPK